MMRPHTLSSIGFGSTNRVPAVDPTDSAAARPTPPEARAASRLGGVRTLSLLIVFALQVAFFSFVALHRFIDGDEGFYLLASRLVLHKRLYLDFLYEQTPLLPYVYGVWMKVFGVTWVSARILAALLTSALGTLVCEDVWRQTRSWVCGTVAAILFAASTLVFGFLPIVKIYSLAGLALFAAYVTISRFTPRSSLWLAACSGLLFACSVSTRSYLVVLLPWFLGWIVRGSEPGGKIKSSVWFLGGAAVGMIPSLYFFLMSPAVFLFNNLGIHAIRSDSGLVGLWQQKIIAIFQLFLGGPETNGIQTSILFFVSWGFISLIGKRRYAPRFAFHIVIVIVLVSLLPTPAWPQYFCLCVPFLLVSAICTANDGLDDLRSRRTRAWWLAACALAVVIYVVAAIPDLHRYLVTGVGVPGVKLAHEPNDLKLQRVVEVSQAIDQVAQPGEAVASFWPGYSVQTWSVPFPGFEADYGLPLSGRLTAEQRAKYHILSAPEIEAEFAIHRPRVVVLRDPIQVKGGEPLRKLLATEDALRNALCANGYTVFRKLGGVSIYVASPTQ